METAKEIKKAAKEMSVELASLLAQKKCVQSVMHVRICEAWLIEYANKMEAHKCRKQRK